jgi:hypothetical protein
MIRRIQGFCRIVVAGAFALSFVAIPEAVLAATFNHQQIAYYVPEKRIRVDAGISDPRGVQVARVYFKAGAQADYIFVPMAQSGGRYVATLPAPSASTSSMEYLFLALNNDGQVSRTEAYKVAARRSNETPSWQSASGQGEVKVFTEIPNAPKPVAMYSDSIAMDVVESGARLGAAAGLYAGGGGGGGAAGAATAKSGAAAETTATAATTGGLSTAAIVGGVVLAGAAVAAAASGGGGGSSGSSTPSGTSFAGTYTGTQSGNININCGAAGSAQCTFTAPVTISVSSSNTATGTSGNGTVNCNVPGFGSAAQSVASGGAAASGPVSPSGVLTVPGQTITQSGVTVTCIGGSITLNATSHTMSGSQSCQGTFNQPGASCSFTFSLNYQ